MAEDSSILVDHLQFCCSVCLELLRDPVTTPCGHSFCMVCINDFWNQLSQKGVYSCPQCRESFMPRPVLRRNNVMAEVVEKLKLKDLKGASPTYYNFGSVDVECDLCSENKDKAVRSCLVCLASFCQTHVKPHFESPTFRRHKLVHAQHQLQDKVCSRHNKLIDTYCRTDEEFICALCMVDTHKGHKTASIDLERTEKQNQITEMQRKSQQQILEKENKLQDLKQAITVFKMSAQAAVEESERIFNEILLSFEEKCSKVIALIRAQEESELNQAEELIEQIELEIADLKKRDTELELLSLTDDHVHFLRRFQEVCFPTAKDLRKMNLNLHVSFDRVSEFLSDLKEQLDDFYIEEFNKIHPNIVKVQMVLPCEPRTREEFLQYFCHLTLDANTANDSLLLYENNRKVTRSGHLKAYPSHPERFDGYGQVLCKESVCGRCYWEVEWSRGGWVYLSVAYKGISRKGHGKECWFGHNNQSWSLECSSNPSFWHNDIQTKIHGQPTSRIGVFVDYIAGTLSFYSVSDTMTLLHKFQTTFSQPLYPGFWVNVNATAKLCYVK